MSRTLIKFKKLSNQERKQYVANTIKQSPMSLVGPEFVAIGKLTRNLSMDDLNLESRAGCFDWSDTPQGHTYWQAIEQRVTGGESFGF